MQDRISTGGSQIGAGLRDAGTAMGVLEYLSWYKSSDEPRQKF
jgi:hypothetical protein